MRVLGVVDVRQAFDLLDVENGIALHVWNFALDILAGRVVVLGADDGVGKDHKRALSPLPTWAFSSLAWRKVIRMGAGKILAQGTHPEGKRVDSGIGLSGVSQRTSNSAGGVFSVPGAYPRSDTFLQILHNLSGDAAVYVFFFSVALCIVFSFRNNFFFAKPATV